jgi:CBS domain-containing protein
MEQTMTETAAPQPPKPPAPATVADVMHPALTTVEQGDHVAAAAYLMKHANATALMVVDPQSGEPRGIITEADIARVVADGKNVNDVRIQDLMTSEPTVISATTTIRKAARMMTNGHFRHLPVVDDTGLIGMVDISEVCAALLGPDD